MSLADPALLALGLVVAAALALAAIAVARRRAAALAAAGVAPGGSGRSRRRGRLGGMWFTIAGVAILAIAVGGPAASVPVSHAAGTVILAMDVSGSMSATDVAPSRLAAAKQAALSFIDAQPGSVDIGVVAFQQGGLEAALPTADHTIASAAVIRFGFTSVEHMEPDTSSASMIVADDDATGTVACGRAAPTASTPRPSISSAAGMRRRQRERPGRAVRTSAIEVTRTAARRRRRRISHQTANTSGMTRSASSAHGQEKDIQTTRPVLTTVSTAPAASSARASAMNAPASGSGCLVTVSLRSIDEAIPLSSLASDAGWYAPPVACEIAVRVDTSSAVYR